MRQIRLFKSPILAVILVVAAAAFAFIGFSYNNYTSSVNKKISEVDRIEAQYNSELMLSQLDKLNQRVVELEFKEQSQEEVLKETIVLLDDLLKRYGATATEDRPVHKGNILSIPVTIKREFPNAVDFIGFLRRLIENKHPHISVVSVDLRQNTDSGYHNAEIKVIVQDSYVEGR